MHKVWFRAVWKRSFSLTKNNTGKCLFMYAFPVHFEFVLFYLFNLFRLLNISLICQILNRMDGIDTYLRIYHRQLNTNKFRYKIYLVLMPSPISINNIFLLKANDIHMLQIIKFNVCKILINVFDTKWYTPTIYFCNNEFYVEIVLIMKQTIM